MRITSIVLTLPLIAPASSALQTSPPSFTGLIEASRVVAGSMETTRLVPDAIQIASDEFTPAAFLDLAAQAIVALDAGDPAPVLVLPPDRPAPFQTIEALAQSGVLTGGQANSLIVKLDGAASSLDSGNETSATNQIEAYDNEVDALLGSGQLTQAQADDLRVGLEDFPRLRDLYPSITLDPSFYLEPFDRAAFAAFFAQVLAESSDPRGIGETITVPRGEVRFAEALYYGASVLRSVRILDQLPELLRKNVISPRGLVPWSTPVGLEEYTSALSNDAAIPFFVNSARRYYSNTSHHFEMFDLAMQIAGQQQDPFRAGEAIFDWVLDQWASVVGTTSVIAQFFGDYSGRDGTAYFMHTSGPPKIVINDLLRALGIPASNGGSAFFESDGWVNIDIHRPFGTDPQDNPFTFEPTPPRDFNMPAPVASHDFIGRIKAIRDVGAGIGSPGEERSVYVNGRDVIDYGPEFILDNSGDFDVIIVTVKTPRGLFFFDAPNFSDRFIGDALTDLIPEAHARGKRVFASFTVLADRMTAAVNPEWRQFLNSVPFGSTVFPNAHISPCVDAYRQDLELALGTLVTSYDLDGVVLDNVWFANAFGNTDTVGHPDCPTGTDWMSTVVTDYAASLADVIRLNAPAATIVLGIHSRFGFENRYVDFSPPEIGHQDLGQLGGIADHLLLPIVGTYWVPFGVPYFIDAITDFRALTGNDPWVSFALVDEWEYTAGYYEGLLGTVRAQGISGFDLHGVLSTAGDLAPAFTRSQWRKVREIDAD